MIHEKFTVRLDKLTFFKKWFLSAEQLWELSNYDGNCKKPPQNLVYGNKIQQLK